VWRAGFGALAMFFLRYLTPNFTPKTALLRDSMSFVIYGGATNGHAFQRTAAVHPDLQLDPPSPRFQDVFWTFFLPPVQCGVLPS